MSSLVKLANDSQIHKYLRLELAPGVECKPTLSLRGAELSGEPYCLLHSGAEAGMDADLADLKAKSRYKIELGRVTPYLYQALVHVNPALAELGTFLPETVILEPREPYVVSYIFQPFKNCDLTNLDWHVRMYIID